MPLMRGGISFSITFLYVWEGKRSLLRMCLAALFLIKLVVFSFNSFRFFVSACYCLFCCNFACRHCFSEAAESTMEKCGKLPYTRLLRLHKSETIQYYCNYCPALGNFWKFLSCLFSQYEKYYCLVLKFLIILELRRHTTKGESII